MALLLLEHGLHGETAELSTDPALRLQWLNSRVVPKPALRGNSQGVGVRTIETRSTEPRPTPARSTETSIAKPRAAETPRPEPRPVKATTTEARVAKASPAAPRLAEKRPAETHVAEAPSIKFHSAPTVAESRYPWKTGIVTTVFWIGEPVGGNNFTPNVSSSWDANWTRSYGGFDNPDPAARRNFIPVKFVPRQNPFYVALPYNDVTRGTTKPEARRVIPWFKEAFRREGQSVCRDRWVAVRSRSGRIAYAQWSDCGPFRTDHWQYVFGKEKPKPNLNQGAGLDVSPAMRDYLGLASTDVTDWKFVELRDVPNGPWSLYGENNVFAQKTSRPSKGGVKPGGRTAANFEQIRIREVLN